MIMGTFKWKTVARVALALGVLLPWAAWSVAQETTPANPNVPDAGSQAPAVTTASPPAAAPAAVTTGVKKFRGRLPAHYSTIVSSDQRQKIYDIQSGYYEKIADLERQILELRTKQDQEVEAVLTPQQLSDVKKLREASSTKRRGRSSVEATAGTGQN